MSILWDGEYDPEEMLDYCTVSPFEGNHQMDSLITNILATIVICKDTESLKDELKKLLRESCKISIGKSLQKLSSIAETGPELKFDRDGLDALTYHLSSCTIERAIRSLNKILDRFKRNEQ